MSDDVKPATDADRIMGRMASVLMCMAQHNVPPDVQEMLVKLGVIRGIASAMEADAARIDEQDKRIARLEEALKIADDAGAAVSRPHEDGNYTVAEQHGRAVDAIDTSTEAVEADALELLAIAERWDLLMPDMRDSMSNAAARLRALAAERTHWKRQFHEKYVEHVNAHTAHARGWAAAIERAAEDVRAEEELDGPMPLHLMVHPSESVARAAVRATKENIEKRILSRRDRPEGPDV